MTQLSLAVDERHTTIQQLLLGLLRNGPMSSGQIIRTFDGSHGYPSCSSPLEQLRKLRRKVRLSGGDIRVDPIEGTHAHLYTLEEAA